MDSIENGIYAGNGSSTKTHKSFPKQYAIGVKCLKCVLASVYCTKYHEINICHSYE